MQRSKIKLVKASPHLKYQSAAKGSAEKGRGHPKFMSPAEGACAVEVNRGRKIRGGRSRQSAAGSERPHAVRALR